MADAVVIGVGNPDRGDDGAGPALLGRLRSRLPAGAEARMCSGEPWTLIEAWQEAEVAVVVDAMVSGAPPGTVLRLDPAVEPIPAGRARSTHGLGVAAAIGLAAALGRLPRRLILYGVEAAQCGDGPGIGPPVAASLDRLADMILEDLRA